VLADIITTCLVEDRLDRLTDGPGPA
jgi:hypothetical protein